MKSPGLVLVRREDVRFRRIADEGIVLVQEDARVLGVSEVGVRILELVDGTRSLSQVVDVLESEFEAERAELEADVDLFLDRLLEAGVVRNTLSAIRDEVP